MSRALALVVAFAGLPVQTAPVRVEPGVFLVAKPSISDGLFHRSVVLVLEHEETGTLGVIVNRNTGVPLNEALPGLDEAAVRHELFFGGPVAMDGLYLAFRNDEPREDAKRIVADVYYSGDRRVLEALLDEGRTADELRLYLGHAGWAPGQLEGEILRGDWQLVSADPASIFASDPEALWERLTKSGRLTAGASGFFRSASRSARAEAP